MESLKSVSVEKIVITKNTINSRMLFQQLRPRTSNNLHAISERHQKNCISGLNILLTLVPEAAVPQKESPNGILFALNGILQVAQDNQNVVLAGLVGWTHIGPAEIYKYKLEAGTVRTARRADRVLGACKFTRLLLLELAFGKISISLDSFSLNSTKDGPNGPSRRASLPGRALV